MVETESGKTNINRSEAFNFDNTGPVTTLTSTPVSENSFTLSATASDNETQVTSYKFYVNDELKETIETNEDIASYTETGEDMGEVKCYVIATDRLGNETKQTVTARTQMYTWERWNVIATKIYKQAVGSIVSTNYRVFANTGTSFLYRTIFNNTTGSYSQGSRFTCFGQIGSTYVYGKGSSAQQNGALYYCYLGSQNSYGSIFKCYKIYRATSELSSSVDSKGTIQYEDATSTSSTEYPTNGKSGEYWYVYKGIQ